MLSQLFPLEESEYTNALAPRKYPRQANSVAPRYDHTHIETIDVTCDQKNGMFVTIEFESDFQGIIYSQGYFNDPKCRYVTPGRGGRQFSFTVPFNGCGSKPSCSVCSSVDNVLVIQSDEDVQEAWDTARRISCSQVEQQQNTIFFKPFVVDMLEVVNVPTATGGVECWMDIQRGSYPSISPIPSIIKIGEALSILVYLRDPRGEYDVSVRDCYAYDSPDYDAQGTKRLQLSDKNGCSRKKKLFGQWQKTTQTGNTGATLIVHNDIKAFKFPDRMQVFLKCDIEICRGGCGPQVCEIEELVKAVEGSTTTKRPTPAATVPPRRGTRPPQTIPATFPTRGRRPVSTALPSVPITTQRTVTYTTQTPQRRTRPTTAAPVYQPTTTAPQRRRTRPPTVATTEFVCAPGSTDDRCNTILVTDKPNCYRGSRDPRCRQQATPAPATTPASLRCFPGSTDPRCPTVAPAPTTPAPPRCFPGSRDPRCPTVAPAPTTPAPPRCFPGSTDPRCPTIAPPTTPAPLKCFPGSNDPRCPTEPPVTTPAPPRCFPGSSDPRCPTTFRPSTERATRPTGRGTRPTGRGTRPPRPVTEAPIYVPPVESQRTTSAPDCYPGSTDRRCPRPVPSTPRPVEEVRPSPSEPNCYPGSNDPRCRTPVLRCTPGSTDPRCPGARPTTSAPRCYPGSQDPSCFEAPTYLPPEQSTTTTQRPTPPPTTATPRCYPGSPDPRCPQTTTRATTQAPRCYPGSTDPRCPQTIPAAPTTTPAPRCYPGLLDGCCL